MIAIDNILISEDVIQEQFVCDLNRCKGGCCEDGDAGAPLTDEEVKIVEEVYEKIRHYLPAESIKEIEAKGKYGYDEEFGNVTPTLHDNKGICVYAFRDKRGIIKCAFEQAYYEGLIDWKKPISCHLYPIIAKKGKHGDYENVNYYPREVLCAPACSQGKKLKVPVYVFLKEPLIRKYGEEFYEALVTIAQQFYGHSLPQSENK